MTIGIIAEGARDCEMIESIVQKANPGSICRYLQPDDFNAATYGGWKSANYHGHKVNRKDGKLKKSKSLYFDFLIPKLIRNWDTVQHICLTARMFQEDMNDMFSSSNHM